MIVGNTKKIEFLKKINNIPHAMLFSGPELIGKKKISLEFIKSIFCKESCQNCYSCKSIDSNSFPDLNIVEPIEGNIAIEELRNFIQKLSLKSYNNGLKVGIINDAHLMKKDAQNALLKTLEEPKGGTLIILISHHPEMILKTVRSRLINMKFSLAPNKEIEDYLISLGASKEKAREITLISSGQVGKAVNFYNDPLKVNFLRESIEDIISLTKSEMYKRFEYAKKFKEENDKIVEILEIWERFFRKEMMSKIFNNNSSLNNYSFDKIKEIVKEIEKTKYLIESSNINKKMALENLLISL